LGEKNVLLLRFREPYKRHRFRKTWKEVVEKDVDDLHIKPE